MKETINLTMKSVPNPNGFSLSFGIIIGEQEAGQIIRYIAEIKDAERARLARHINSK